MSGVFFGQTVFAGAAHTSAADGSKWQQFCEAATLDVLSDLNGRLKQLGDSGWELTGMNSSIACFKRPGSKAPIPLALNSKSDATVPQAIGAEAPLKVAVPEKQVVATQVKPVAKPLVTKALAAKTPAAKTTAANTAVATTGVPSVNAPSANATNSNAIAQPVVAQPVVAQPPPVATQRRALAKQQATAEVVDAQPSAAVAAAAAEVMAAPSFTQTPAPRVAQAQREAHREQASEAVAPSRTLLPDEENEAPRPRRALVPKS